MRIGEETGRWCVRGDGMRVGVGWWRRWRRKEGKRGWVVGGGGREGERIGHGRHGRKADRREEEVAAATGNRRNRRIEEGREGREHDPDGSTALIPLCQDPMILDMEISQKLGEIGARVLRSDKSRKLEIKCRR